MPTELWGDFFPNKFISFFAFYPIFYQNNWSFTQIVELENIMNLVGLNLWGDFLPYNEQRIHLPPASLLGFQPVNFEGTIEPCLDLFSWWIFFHFVPW